MKQTLALIGLLVAPLFSEAQQCTVHETRIPADIPVPNAQATASTFQQFSWESFLGLNAAEVGGPPADVPAQAPLWHAWSSTVDMLSCQGSPRPAGCSCPGGDCGESGTRYFPAACRGIDDFENYRVLQQRGRFDNSFLEADVAGLTNSPVTDRFGNFLRYEILVSPATYADVLDKGLWSQSVLDENEDELVFKCSDPAYTGGDPAEPGMGDMVLKLAWMDVEGEAGATLNLNHYFTEDLLVYTPGYRSSDGVERCELRTMAMVGMHIAHKTLRQPNWIWSTFEHRDAAPNCTDEMPDPGDPQTNMSCPPSVPRDYTLYGMQCNDGDAACAACNVTPAGNDEADRCRNPTTPELEGWCLDQPPAAEQGTSRLCRHVPVLRPVLTNLPAPIPDPLPDNYPQAAAWNQACVNELELGGHLPWSRYLLISGQWLGASALPPEPAPPAMLECDTVADDIFSGIVNAGAIEPKVQTRSGDMRPFLGNITMESYGKSNCIGCHSRAAIENAGGESYTTDLMYFPSIQVARQSGNFLTHMASEPASYCDLPDNPAVLEFDIAAAVANAVVVEQSMNLLLGIELPEALPAPAVSAREPDNPGQPWMPGGEVVNLLPDETCTAGDCPVDRLYPSGPRQVWRQYRSMPAISIDPDRSAIAARIVIAFDGLTCADVDPLDIRLWVSDDSQARYANQVDGDYLDRTLFLLPQPPAPASALPTVTALGPRSLAILITLTLAVGLWFGRRA